LNGGRAGGRTAARPEPGSQEFSIQLHRADEGHEPCGGNPLRRRLRLRQIRWVHIIHHIHRQPGLGHGAEDVQQPFRPLGLHGHVALVGEVELAEQRLDQHAVHRAGQLRQQWKTAVDDDLMAGIFRLERLDEPHQADAEGVRPQWMLPLQQLHAVHRVEEEAAVAPLRRACGQRVHHEVRPGRMRHVGEVALPHVVLAQQGDFERSHLGAIRGVLRHLHHAQVGDAGVAVAPELRHVHARLGAEDGEVIRLEGRHVRRCGVVDAERGRLKGHGQKEQPQTKPAPSEKTGGATQPLAGRTHSVSKPVQDRNPPK
jgi:hypothetical protein